MTGTERYNGLGLLYPPFKARLLRGLELAQQANIPVKIFETFRTRERQAMLYAQGRTTEGNIVTNAKPGFTYHNYGIAADLVMYIDGQWTWRPLDLYESLVKYMTLQGLESLSHKGDWPHYQLPNLNIHELSNLYDRQRLEGVWLKLNKTFGGLNV